MAPAVLSYRTARITSPRFIAVSKKKEIEQSETRKV